LTELNQCLSTKTYSEIIEIVESVAIEILEMQFKKFDQKKERELTIQLRESTRSALENENDPATILQLVSLLIYNHTFEVMLNAPGRCVPLILESLRSNMKEEIYEKLTSFQSKFISLNHLSLT
jgi:E3 UFM1-protein ligase 1